MEASGGEKEAAMAELEARWHKVDSEKVFLWKFVS